MWLLEALCLDAAACMLCVCLYLFHADVMWYVSLNGCGMVEGFPLAPDICIARLRKSEQRGEKKNWCFLWVPDFCMGGILTGPSIPQRGYQKCSFPIPTSPRDVR